MVKMIILTEFGMRHFDKKFGGTKILSETPEEFMEQIEAYDFQYDHSGRICGLDPDCNEFHVMELDGYAPFCKLIPLRNWTSARVGSMPITMENYPFIRSGYSARRDEELPVFSRWLEIPRSIQKPKAKYLMLVLYSREQLEKEAKGQDNATEMFGFDADWGIVAILGQSHPGEEPMKPETMLRNALGIKEGGSGVELNRETYLKSVEFWDKNITVK